FFFSSRRRHTRSKRDWSSDVCSSDLWGVLADRIGYRRTMIVCSGLCFISKIVFWQANGFADFLVERVMLSVVLAGFSGVDSSIQIGRASCREGVERHGVGGAA